MSFWNTDSITSSYLEDGLGRLLDGAFISTLSEAQEAAAAFVRGVQSPADHSTIAIFSSVNVYPPKTIVIN